MVQVLCFLELSYRLGKPAHGFVGSAQVEVSNAHSGIQRHGLSVLLDGLRVLVSVVKVEAEACIDERGKWIKLQSPFRLHDGFVQSPQRN